MKTIFTLFTLILILCQCSTYKYGLTDQEQEQALTKYYPNYYNMAIVDSDNIPYATWKISRRIFANVLLLGIPEREYAENQEKAFKKYIVYERNRRFNEKYAGIVQFENKIVSNVIDTPVVIPPQSKEFTSRGTGFSVSPYRIVTAYHVVENADSIQVQFNYEPWQNAELELMDESLDIAVLKLSKPHEYFLTFSDTPPGLGDKIFSIGFPFTELLGNEAKFTEGTLSSFTGLFNDPSWYQVTIPVQPGNSGGPVMTEDGVLIGMVVATASAKKFVALTGNLPQNVNYAVKGNYIRTLVERKEKLPLNPPLLSRKFSIRLTQDSVCKIKSEGRKISKS